jgi:hypothetical protein
VGSPGANTPTCYHDGALVGADAGGRSTVKNLMVYVIEGGGVDREGVRRQLDVQVANSLDLGWRPEDVLLMTNFPYQRSGVAAIQLPDASRPRTARVTSFHKTRAILDALDRVGEDEVVWYHDVDAFQLQRFERRPSPAVLSFCLYSTRERLLVQGGSLFFTRAARPVFAWVFDSLLHRGCRKDEFALTDAAGWPAFGRPGYEGFFAVLDYSYNLGSSDFGVRYQSAEKPIKVAHLHLDRPAPRAIFLGGRNSLGVRPVDERFLALLEEHGFGWREEEALPRQEPLPPRYYSTSPLLKQIRRVLKFVR